MIYPNADTYVSEEYSDKNFHGAENLFVSNYVDKRYNTLMKFDLSVIPSNVNILNINLYTYLFAKAKHNTSRLKIYPLLENFEEDVVTWDKYSYDKFKFVYKDITKNNVNKYIKVDLSRFGCRWYKENMPNYGVIMMLDNYNDDFCGFFSTKYGYLSKKPYLAVTIDENVSPYPQYEVVIDIMDVIPSEQGTFTSEINTDYIAGISFYVQNNDSLETIRVQLQVSFDGNEFFQDGDRKSIPPLQRTYFSTSALAKKVRLVVYGVNIFSISNIKCVYYRAK